MSDRISKRIPPKSFALQKVLNQSNPYMKYNKQRNRVTAETRVAERLGKMVHGLVSRGLLTKYQKSPFLIKLKMSPYLKMNRLVKLCKPTIDQSRFCFRSDQNSCIHTEV